MRIEGRSWEEGREGGGWKGRVCLYSFKGIGSVVMLFL